MLRNIRTIGFITSLGLGMSVCCSIVPASAQINVQQTYAYCRKVWDYVNRNPTDKRAWNASGQCNRLFNNNNNFIRRPIQPSTNQYYCKTLASNCSYQQWVLEQNYLKENNQRINNIIRR